MAVKMVSMMVDRLVVYLDMNLVGCLVLMTVDKSADKMVGNLGMKLVGMLVMMMVVY